MKETTVSLAPVGVVEAVLPVRVQEALGELVGAAREGLLALSVGVGLGVLAELMEEEVCEAVGPKGRHDADRVAVRHGHEAGEVTLGGRRVQVERPRVRSADGRSELPLATYAHFADRDPLTQVVLERMLAGVSTRRFRRTQEPVGATIEQAARSTSKSAVSRSFVERTREALGELMGRRLDDVRVSVMMLDGIELKGHTNIVALGVTTDGVKIPLGLWEGSTENATVARPARAMWSSTTACASRCSRSRARASIGWPFASSIALRVSATAHAAAPSALLGSAGTASRAI